MVSSDTYPCHANKDTNRGDHFVVKRSPVSAIALNPEVFYLRPKGHLLVYTDCSDNSFEVIKLVVVLLPIAVLSNFNRLVD